MVSQSSLSALKNRKTLLIEILRLFVFTGCAALYKKEIPEEPIIPELKSDLDPEGQKIYRVSGFYEDPLYRIYPDRSERRKRIN
jgi:hypothetical protein